MILEEYEGVEIHMNRDTKELCFTTKEQVIDVNGVNHTIAPKSHTIPYKNESYIELDIALEKCFNEIDNPVGVDSEFWIY